MINVMSVVMGIADIIAGILIILGFGNSILGIIFGIAMIGKGGLSFIG
jgi:hypothetical protein